MAEASISVDQEQFSCPVCLDLLKDPVTINCGHSFCMVCINDCWDQNEQSGVYSCPQCRETFSPRPVLRRNNMLAEVVEKLKKTELEAASTVSSYAGPGDVECDFCTGRKRKAFKSCLVCLVSVCETHLAPHCDVPALKKHKLVKASSRLQENICSQHDEVLKIYCRTDQNFVCYLCTMDEHKGHDTVSAVAERTEKQCKLKEEQKKSWIIIQEKEKKVKELKQTVDNLKRSAQAAVEDSERIFSELVFSIEQKRSEVRELIRAQEKSELSRAEGLLKQLEQEIDDLKRRDTELEQLSHTEDHIHFLQSFQSFCPPSMDNALPSITANQTVAFDEMRNSLSNLEKRLQAFCKVEFNKITPQVTSLRMVSPSEPKTRNDFVKYFCRFTLDPNTAHHFLTLSEKNRVVKNSGTAQPHPAHPERFDSWFQVLCKERVCGRCYWEVEWNSGGYMYMSLSYKGISRKGLGNECRFGSNEQSWSLQCSPAVSFWHNNTETEIPGPLPSRIGVYVDHSAGTLSFYRVSDTMTILHRVHTTFTQPLYAGFRIFHFGSVKLCELK